jgi:hypothetical protein
MAKSIVSNPAVGEVRCECGGFISGRRVSFLKENGKEMTCIGCQEAIERREREETEDKLKTIGQIPIAGHRVNALGTCPDVRDLAYS